jgi:dolichol-phosphate mannosyltransferase
MSAPELTIVLPAYREAESLATLLPVLKAKAAELTSNFEILVIDTEQPMDQTAEVCAAAGVRHIHRRGGNNYGDAVRTGIAESRGDSVIFMDADGSHNPIHLKRLWGEREGYLVVIGSRYVRGGVTENPFILIAMSYAVNLTFRIAFQLKASDVTNSFRLYRGNPLRALHLDSNDFDIVEELLIKLVTGRAHATVKEVPVVFERRKAGESKRNLREFALSYVQTLIRLRKFRAEALRDASLAEREQKKR